MTSQLPRIIEPQQLADRSVVFDGELGLPDLPRVQALLAGGQPAVRVALEFSRSAAGVCYATGALETVLELTCQRCLESISYPMNLVLNWEFLTQETASGELAEPFEPIFAAAGSLDLYELIEDDILLALPIAPMHAAEGCRVGAAITQASSSGRKPFAALAGFKPSK